jgi:hypothetical protein
MNREQRRKNAKNVKSELKASGSKELFDLIGECLNHNELAGTPVNTREITGILQNHAFGLEYRHVLRALKYAASIGLVTELPQKGKASVWVRA